MSEDQEKMVLENRRLVYDIIKKLGLYTQFEDFVDLGMIGLCKGVKTFKPEKGYAISTYLYYCIRNEILMYFRKKRVKQVQTEDSTFDFIQDEDVNIEEEIEKIEQKEMLYNTIERLELTEEELFIIINFYGLYGKPNKTQSEIGKILGKSQEQICKIKNKVTEEIKKKVSDLYDEK